MKLSIILVVVYILLATLTAIYFGIKSYDHTPKDAEGVIIQKEPISTVTFDSPEYYFMVRSDECIPISQLAGYFVGRTVLAVMSQANSMLILLDNRTVLVIMSDMNGNFVGQFVYIDDYKRSE